MHKRGFVIWWSADCEPIKLTGAWAQGEKVHLWFICIIWKSHVHSLGLVTSMNMYVVYMTIIIS